MMNLILCRFSWLNASVVVLNIRCCSILLYLYLDNVCNHSNYSSMLFERVSLSVCLTPIHLELSIFVSCVPYISSTHMGCQRGLYWIFHGKALRMSYLPAPFCPFWESKWVLSLIHDYHSMIYQGTIHLTSRSILFECKFQFCVTVQVYSTYCSTILVKQMLLFDV